MKLQFNVHLNQDSTVLPHTTRLVASGYQVDVSSIGDGKNCVARGGSLIRQLVGENRPQLDSLKRHIDANPNLHPSVAIGLGQDNFNCLVYDQTRSEKGLTFGPNDIDSFWRDSLFNRVYSAQEAGITLPEGFSVRNGLSVCSQYGGRKPFVGGVVITNALEQAIKIYDFAEKIKALDIPDGKIFYQR